MDNTTEPVKPAMTEDKTGPLGFRVANFPRDNAGHVIGYSATLNAGDFPVAVIAPDKASLNRFFSENILARFINWIPADRGIQHVAIGHARAEQIEAAVMEGGAK